MKVLLVAINARYVHTNLAVRYLSSNLEHHDVQVQEYTINHYSHEILEKIFTTGADVIAFSCYIWNIELVLKVVASLKKVHPESVIVLGGPEVSYDSEKVMKQNDAIDFILSGEADVSFSVLMDALENNDDYTGIPQLTFRARGKVYASPPVTDMKHENQIPVAYKDDHGFNPHQIYYYETSRGCPYHCQFCLSGNDTGLILMPLQRVYRDLSLFINHQVKQVKFVDRTFNVVPERTLSIWRFIKENDNGITNFHFEISTSSLTEEMMDFLETVPEGLFQFEIGVQTTNEEALEAIHRRTDLNADFHKIRRLKRMNTIHLHVDLIAGLPHEDFFSFRQSFNQVFNLNTDMLQLGFLKLLKGSGLRSKQLEYEYVYQDEPPYEVLSTHKMTFGELLRLKGIENVLERYWNTGKFRNTIQLVINDTQIEPFAFFEGLAERLNMENPEGNKLNQNEQVLYLKKHLENLMPGRSEFIDAAIIFDVAASGLSKEIGSKMDATASKMIKEKTHNLLHDDLFVKAYFQDMWDEPVKKMLPYIRLVQMPKGFLLNRDNSLAYEESHNQFLWVAFIYPRKSMRTNHISVIVNIKEDGDESSTG